MVHTVSVANLPNSGDQGGHASGNKCTRDMIWFDACFVHCSDC